MKRQKLIPAKSHSAVISAGPTIGKIALVMMPFASVALMVISHQSPNTRQKISAPIMEGTTPILDLLSRPLDSVERLGAWMHNVMYVFRENEKLRIENQRLRHWQQVALQLEAENGALRELAHYPTKETLKFTTAKVISDRSGPFRRTVLMNAGTEHKVMEGQAVITAKGVVGRVLESQRHSARVLLLTDLNSRIPVIAENTRERGIAAGNNSDLLTMMYLPDDLKLEVGERIITSSDGNAVPAGLPVGEVVAIENGQPLIKPYVHGYGLHFVSAIARQTETTP